MSAKPSQKRGLTGGGLLTLTIKMTLMTRNVPKCLEKKTEDQNLPKEN
jgi:hypothetical protein